MKKHSIHYALSAFLVGVILLAVTACTGGVPSTESGTQHVKPAVTPSGKDVILGLTYVPNVQFSPVYVAADSQAYMNAGAHVRLRHHGAEEGLFTALVSGHEDMVLASGDEVLQAREAGMDLVSVGTYYRRSPVAFIVPEESQLHDLRDIAGKRVGIPGEYGSNWFALLAVLADVGLTRQDVEIIPIGYTQQSALAQGQVDVVVGFSNNDKVFMQRSGMNVRELPVDFARIPLVSASLVTTSAWARAHPDLVRAVLNGTRQGIQQVMTHPEEGIEATQRQDPSLSSEGLQTAREVLTATLPLFMGDDGSVSLKQDMELWQRMGDFFAEIPDILSGAVHVDLAVTNMYVE
ncbi:ABC transporter substrate-binding protein [Schaalia sp. lx-100]|uniref:ABC transporter substrate-binding protein n=1 Tax=Schaalia sp. lx-100 TaxID=2899081 RepID=UPI001E396D8E|nr:ABC transporter substrate-binding protein [Schaalia sp. lx-100]MCD4558190.1 ABC transporter substrate-binding protein [Schaalia sp. lx-100]